MVIDSKARQTGSRARVSAARAGPGQRIGHRRRGKQPPQRRGAPQPAATCQQADAFAGRPPDRIADAEAGQHHQRMPERATPKQPDRQERVKSRLASSALPNSRSARPCQHQNRHRQHDGGAGAQHGQKISVRPTASPSTMRRGRCCSCRRTAPAPAPKQQAECQQRAPMQSLADRSRKRTGSSDA